MVTPTPPTGPTAPTAAVAVPARGDTALSTWRVGQVLAATVVTSPQAGRAELRIGTLPVTAQTGNLQLTPGQTLRLEVASLKQLPVLKLLGVLQQSPVDQAVRDALPRQQPLMPLLSALTRLGAGGPLPPEVARFARELISRLPDPASVTQPAGLRQALRDSGLFLEAKLARPAALTAAPGTNPAAARGGEFAGDLKANLLRLLRALRETAANSAPVGPRVAGGSPGAAAAASAATTPPPAAQLAAALAAAGVRPLPGAPPLDPSAPLQRGQPPQPPPAALAQLARLQEQTLSRSELLRQVEGALARVQLNQLSSLPQERAQPPEWLIELPVRREGETDVWGLRISRDPERDGGRDAGRDGDGGPGWTVMLAFDLPGIGPMQSRINLRGEQVGAQFFSREPGILPLVAEHLPLLQARLQQAGLRVADLTCHHGQIPAPAAAPKTGILDDRA
jgi:hypothetical protein